MSTQEGLEKKLRKLNNRYKILGKAHGILCQHVDLVRRELEAWKGIHPSLPPLANSLQVALYGAKRSHQSGGPQVSPSGPRSPLAAPSAPAGGQMSPVGPDAQPFTPASAPRLPPVPPARLLAGLQRARASLVTRQAQLAHCRTCGTEAAAYEQAAADVDTLMAWLGERAR